MGAFFKERAQGALKSAAEWDKRITTAGKQGRPEDAAALFDAAARDFARADFWWDDEKEGALNFEHPEDALQFLGRRLFKCSMDVRAEWVPCGCRNNLPPGVITNNQNTRWKLQEIAVALSEMLRAAGFE